MQLMTNTKARIISSTPLQHRADTLSAISKKAHDLTASVQYLQVTGNRLRELAKNAPGTGQSRIDWLAQQLQNAGI
jgi:hypothetical protein